MGNMFDYLKWRGDIPFDVDPFNEVDGLVLAELAYTQFEEMKGSKLKTFEKIIESVKEIPKERQSEFMEIMGELLQSSTRVAKNTISDRLRQGDQ